MSFRPKQDLRLGEYWDRIPSHLRPVFPKKLLSREAYKWSPEDSKRPTSYLDGIRGLAAFLVVIHHWADMDYLHSTHRHGYWNYEDSSIDRELVKLPIIRLLWNGGHAMVPIFFVISGFSLAYRPVQYIRAQQFDKLLLNMGSSIIRRAPRLCLPPIVMTFFVMVAVRLGLFANRPLPVPTLERFPSVFTQIADWFWDVTYIFDPFSWDFVIWIKYQPHTWTLNTELHGSKWTYMTLLAAARLKQTPRMLALCWWALYCLWHVQYWTFLFVSGIILAEVHHIEQAKNDDEKDKRSYPILWEYGPWVLLFCSLFLCSAPSEEPQTKFMFWRTIWKLNPIPVTHFLGSSDHDYYEKTQRIFLAVGSTGTVFAVSRIPRLIRWFETPAMQYLGKISFALYLVHGPIITIIGWTVLPIFWWMFGVGTYWPPVVGNGHNGPLYLGSSRVFVEITGLLTLFVIVPPMLWLSELFEKYVDQPILRWTKVVADKYSVE